MDWLTLPINYEFMRHALLMGLLVGLFSPVVGCYLVVQRITLLGDVIAHAVLPGLAIANFAGFDILIGAFVSGMLSTGFIAWVKEQSRVKLDSVMALTFASFFALGVTLLTVLRNRVDLDSLLFGDILSTTPTELWRTGITGAVVLGLVLLFYRPLLFYTFDPAGAEAVGLPIRLINFGLMAGITLTIIVGMQAVGVILVISLMVGPSITAYLLVNQLHSMMALGAVIGAIASLSGIYVSYYLDLPSGPAISLVVFTFFILALLLSPSQGILSRHLSRQLKGKL